MTSQLINLQINSNMLVQLNKDQRECKCSTCSQSELGYRVVHRHTARIHQEIDEGLADANAIEQSK